MIPAIAKRRTKTVYKRGLRDGSVLEGDKDFLRIVDMG
jgi:hypothetical protein